MMCGVIMCQGGGYLLTPDELSTLHNAGGSANSHLSPSLSLSLSLSLTHSIALLFTLVYIHTLVYYIPGLWCGSSVDHLKLHCCSNGNSKL